MESIYKLRFKVRCGNELDEIKKEVEDNLKNKENR